MKPISLAIAMICMVLLNHVVFAYEIDTHAQISTQAVLASSLAKDEDLVGYLGLSGTEQFRNSKGDDKTIAQLITDGSKFEDGFFCFEIPARPRNHFFDPLTGQGLHWTVQLFFGLDLIDVTGTPAPDWALEDKNDFGEHQKYSYKDARQYLYNALTATNPTDHDTNFGLTFQTLGHVIHLIEDMAQPQHVRNDVHYASPPDCGIATYLGKLIKENPSLYESYTNHVRDNFFGASSQLPLYKPVDEPEDTSSLTTARAFWHTEDRNPKAGKGIAEFTNANFLSAGTNYDTLRYPSPRFEDATPWEDRNINQRLKSAGVDVPAECLPPNQPCTMVFFRAPVTDNYRPGASGINDYTSTLSIFDQDLKVNEKGFTVTDPETGETRVIKDMFALNRFNFDAAHKFLIPRAVAYSAGLINYFFRGRLAAKDVEFTETGVRLRVKNAIDPDQTPAWKNEVLYAADSSGTRGRFVLAYDYQDAKGTKQYGASEPVAAKTASDGGGDLAPGETSTATYNFALSIPADAHDVHYRLVFRGKLGQEEDAVAVGRVEPVSGFLVSPSYVPTDGIVGSRMIFRNGGTWRLSDQTGLAAGNVDWKGWYVNDRPTRVLSWWGTATRYFPRDIANPLTSVFRYDIYQNGHVLAVTPYRVLGAALIKGGDGTEWLVAICNDGVNDIAYRRRAIANASPALFDPVIAPDGWVEIGRFSDPSLLSADRPWFFNSSGTAAQTLRPAQKTGDDANVFGTKLNRLEAAVSFDSVSFEVKDNIGPIVGMKSFEPQKTEASDDSRTLVGGRTFQFTESGEYIVAVDYKKDEPVECKLIVNNSEKRYVLATQADGGETYEEENERSMSEVLRCGTEQVKLNGDKQTVATDISRISGDLGLRGSRTAVDTELKGFVAAADLRHNVLVSETFETTAEVSDVLVVPNRYLFISDTCRRLLQSDQHGTAVVRRRLDLVGWKGSDITASDRTNTLAEERDTTGGVTFYDVVQLADSEDDCFHQEHSGDPETKRFPEIFGSLTDGAWRVDGGGHLLVSQEIPDGSFNYLSDGDLNQIVPTGAAGSRYDPAFVIK